MKTKKTINFSVRLSEDVHKKLEMLAKHANRSKGNYISTIILENFEKITLQSNK